MKFFDIKRVEEIIDYKFKNKKHLEEALTHSSMGTGFTSYQRFEFLGDAVIDLAVSKHFFLAEPHLGPGELTSVRSANVSNHKLARVAARLGLYHHVRGNNLDSLDDEVEKFEEAVREEEDWLVYGGVKAPKILADIVESIAAAIYVDVDFDMKELCKILERCLLKPIVTLEELNNHPPPIRELYELCQKQGKQIEIKCEIDGSKNDFNASVYIDGKSVDSASSKQNKKDARTRAAKKALSKLQKPKTRATENVVDGVNGDSETEGEDEELHEVGDQKKKWTKPIYKLILFAILLAFLGNVIKD